MHAVSVGEAAAAAPLVEQLRRDRPHIPIFVSVGTPAGRKTAERQLRAFTDGIFYAPFDYVSCVRRTLRAIRPGSLVILETEIWPNLLRETKRTGATVLFASGRISDRSWPRYARWKAAFRPVLEIPDLVLAQSEIDRERFAELGVPANKLRLGGNLKYDFTPARNAGVTMPDCGAGPVCIAASTVGPNERGSLHWHAVDEDALVVEAFERLKRQFPDLLLILAPRQPARFDPVAAHLRKAGVEFVRRTEMTGGMDARLPRPGVLLLDTVGELASFYSLATVVFVGGSIAPRGGHNILEPAAAGVPVVVGPHMQNFKAVADDFLQANALMQVSSADELQNAVAELLQSAEKRQALSSAAIRLLARKRGVSKHIAEILWPLHDGAFPKLVHTAWGIFFLRPMAALWEWGGGRRRARGEAAAQARPPLPASVVSIGGITMGGAGKTPMCDYIARYLRRQGFFPAILTRGYGRRSPAAAVVVPAGAHVPSALTGDEAQIFLRAGHAALGIGSDRYAAAELLLEQIPQTDVFLLDDGFQHARMRRDFDIVVIDGLDPFGGDCVFPIGRLREPLEALKRADAFVVTRADEEGRFEAICGRIREWNPHASCYRARLIPRCWHDALDGEPMDLEPGQTVAAFCGLGNPQNFWNTLSGLGLDVAFRWTFDDHHDYQSIEIARLAHQARNHNARVLVTTEKDAINLPGNTECLLRDLRMAWLEIELVVEGEARFFSEVRKCLARRMTDVRR